jgi:N utilization substance protein B
MASRHRSREQALQMLYQWDVTKADPEQVIEAYWGGLSADEGTRSKVVDAFANRLVEGVARRIEQIDDLIKTHAANWRLERMSAVDRSILRMAVYEMLENTDLAPVVINEAIEIGRRFSARESAGFLNGVLDAIRKSLEEANPAPVGSHPAE